MSFFFLCLFSTKLLTTENKEIMKIHILKKKNIGIFSLNVPITKKCYVKRKLKRNIL